MKMPRNRKASKSDKSVGWRKRLVYFVIGLVFNFVAIIPVGLWLVFKVNYKRKIRFFSFVMGVFVYFIINFIFGFLFGERVEGWLTKKYPELGYVTEAVEQKYPEPNFKVAVNINTVNTKQDTTRFIKVLISSNKDLDQFQRNEIARITCESLQKHGDEYDKVYVTSVRLKRLLFINFTSSASEGKSCSEWLDFNDER